MKTTPKLESGDTKSGVVRSYGGAQEKGLRVDGVVEKFQPEGRRCLDNVHMAIAALIISVFALLASASSVFYTRRQAIHAGDVVAIERQRSHTERTPVLLVRSADEYHDDSNQHETAVNITNRASFSLHRISARAITDRPGKRAIIGVVALDGRFVHDRPGIVIDRLEPGRTSSFEVVLAWAGERSQSGVLSLEMHDASGELWIIEVELEFPTSPHLW